MVIESRNAGIVSREDNRRLLFVQHYDWALKMTFRYLGEYEAAVATVHNAFLRLFQSDGRGQLFDRKPLEKIFVRAAVNAALQRGDDTIPAREGHAKTYLRQLAVCDSKTADLSKYRNAIGQLLLLPLYPRLAYNLCVVEIGRAHV